MPGVNWAAKLINAGSQIDAGSVARKCVRTYVRDDLWPRVFYHSTATVQTTHARLFVAVAALARNAARFINKFNVSTVRASNLINAGLDWTPASFKRRGYRGPEGNNCPGVYSRK